MTNEGQILTQSLAICEFLDEIRPDPPLLPNTPLGRAHVRAVAQAIACDIHPVQNLKVLEALRTSGQSEQAVMNWAAATIDEGLSAVEQLLTRELGRFAFGDLPSLADICIVPQLANARRFKVPVRWPRLAAIEDACLALDAFQKALPENQPDAD